MGSVRAGEHPPLAGGGVEGVARGLGDDGGRYLAQVLVESSLALEPGDPEPVEALGELSGGDVAAGSPAGKRQSVSVFVVVMFERWSR